MRKYELTYLVSDEIPESDLNKVTGKVSGFVKELGGKTTKEDIWGRRKLAYPIKKQDFATYVTLYFDLPATKAIEFEKDLRLIDGVLRQLMIVKELSNEKLSLTAEEIANVDEIGEVVGGEKSFEAVVGETEASKDLMAKRQEEKVIEEPATKKVVKETVQEEEKIEAPVKKITEAKASTIPEEKKTEEIPEVEKTSPAKKAATKEKPQPKADQPVVEKAKKAPAKKNASDEADRLSKLNDELDDILKDEL